MDARVRMGGGPWLVALAAAAVLGTAYTPASGQDSYNTGLLHLYSEYNGSTCFAVDRSPGTLTVYVYHDAIGPDGAAGSYFRIVTGGGFTGEYLSESYGSHATLGSMRDGIHVIYDGACLDGPVWVAQISYTTYGTSPSCSYVAIVAHPDAASGMIEVDDCNYALHATPVSELRLMINWGWSCQPWCIVATEETTWGKVKALYR
jgi:hypothetical protein